jgi:cell division septal protein FtsQ
MRFCERDSSGTTEPRRGEGDGADSPTRAKQVKPKGRNAQSEAARPKKNKIEWLFIVYFYILFVTCITFYNFIINFT